MDELLPQTMLDFLSCTAIVIGTVIFVCIANPFVLIAFVPCCVLLVMLRRFYLHAAREVKRLEAVSRSPMFTVLSESLDGLVSIRALAVQAHFAELLANAMDANSSAYFWFLASSRWFAVRLEALSALFLAATIIFSLVVMSISRDVIPPGMLGLALTFTLQLAGVWQWSVRQSAEVENQMVSVERIVGFSQTVPEAPLLIEKEAPPSSWPPRGDIHFIDACVRYRPELPLVLQNISVHIPAGSTAGVVGRTGAGKSTMLQALFRLVELESGRVEIDGLDVSRMGLHHLRRSIAAIPQIPILFAGSLRYNLDPFDEYSDDELWRALEQAQLKAAVATWPERLERVLSHSGSNLSTGEKQLLCLARAALRQNKILVLDEPTANVDAATDAVLQAAVRKAFADSTVLMIAHRLATVIDCDSIIVLDSGKVVECGPPLELLHRPQGVLTSLAIESGKAEELRSQAWAHSNTKQDKRCCVSAGGDTMDAIAFAIGRVLC